MIRVWVLCLPLLLLLIRPAYGTDVIAQQAEALDLQTLEDMTRGYLDTELKPDINFSDGLKQLFLKGTAALRSILNQGMRSGVMLLLIVLFCGMAVSFDALSGKPGMDAVTLVGAAAITMMAAGDIHSLVGLGRETIDQLESFSKALLPTIAAAAAGSGAVSGAAARQMGTVFFSDILMTCINRLLMPLVYAYVAACTAYAAVGNDGMKEIAGFLKWVVTTILTALLLVFVGYLTVSGAAASGVDAITIKATKTAISGMVPVVGGVLSDATETVLAGAGVLKNAVGVFGMLGVLAFCLIPFLHLGVHYLVYKLAAVASSTMAVGRIAWLISGIGGAVGLVLGMTGACALLMLISLASSLMVVMP